MTDLPYEVEVVTRCPFTPETCMDDMCRNSDFGLCGKERASEDWGEDAEVYSYQWPEDDDELYA